MFLIQIIESLDHIIKPAILIHFYDYFFKFIA